VAGAPGAAAHADACRNLLVRLRGALHQSAGVTLLLATDRTLRTLNRRHRGLDRATDVLSFPAAGTLEPGVAHLGEIAISLGTAARQARRAGWPLGSEIALLVTHGFLHLLGYDHETDDGTMHRLEERLLRRLGGVSLEHRALPWGDVPGRGTRRRAAKRAGSGHD
jgi:probable rRNA maturation factor